MNKNNLKTLISDLERAVSDLKAEVYSDESSYLTYDDYKKLDGKDLNYGHIYEDDE